MTTKDIRPSDTYTVCDVCGRTLLRGERAEVFVHAGVRRSVCELCKSRALHEGWVREGALPDYGASDGFADRRRTLFGRLRRTGGERTGASPTLDDALSDDSWQDAARPPRSTRSRAGRRPAPIEFVQGTEPLVAPLIREPRHVRAVPTSADHKIASALEKFNKSEHPRTIAGVARSLGAPIVNVQPDLNHPTLVRVTASWELCWYRYEVDLADDQGPGVRLDAQGYELSELSEGEQLQSAVADEAGRLAVA